MSIEPVRIHDLPRWLRIACIREAKPQEPARGIDDWEILRAIDAGGHFWLDHYGSATIQGQTCFVNEPYDRAEKSLADMRRLAAVVGGHAYVTHRSYHGNGTVRAILSPHSLSPRFDLSEFVDEIVVTYAMPVLCSQEEQPIPF